MVLWYTEGVLGCKGVLLDTAGTGCYWVVLRILMEYGGIVGGGCHWVVLGGTGRYLGLLQGWGVKVINIGFFF